MALSSNLIKQPINGSPTGPRINTVQADFVFNNRNEFSRREVGLNHPDNDSFLRLTDNGDIEIMAAPGVGIIISAVTRTVSILADTLKIYTTEDDGIRWNKMAFNYAGSNFTEPFLVPLGEFQKSPAYHDYQEYVDKIKSLKNQTEKDTVTISDSFSYGAPSIYKEATFNVNKSYDEFLSEDEIKLLNQEAKTSSQAKIDYIKKLIAQGYTFNQAKNKASRDLEKA